MSPWRPPGGPGCWARPSRNWPDEDLARLTDYLERLNASVARHLPVSGASGASGVPEVSADR
ncbi:hypothetical protein [Streptomyces iranensis]|uniref:hypothetical protein n=1 Tax=Streptomyces iranensis TaxID=576784 RepID=UPI0039B77098